MLRHASKSKMEMFLDGIGRIFSHKLQHLTTRHQRDRTTLIANHPSTTAISGKNSHIVITTFSSTMVSWHLSSSNHQSHHGQQTFHQSSSHGEQCRSSILSKGCKTYQDISGICPLMELHHLHKPQSSHTLHRRSTTTGERVAQKKSLHNAALMDTMPSPKVTPYFS